MKTDGGLRPIFARKIMEDAHWQSIETGGTGRGIPDVNYCIDGDEGWIEFKQTEGYSIDLRPEQIAWIERRARCGGRVFIAVRRKTKAGPRKGKAVDELWLLNRHATRLRSLKDARKMHTRGVWEGGPANWDWHEIRGLLTGHFIA